MTNNKQSRLESGIIGILLRNPDAVTKFSINPETFKEFRKVMLVILKMAGEGKATDILSISEYLNDKDLMIRLWDIQKNELGALSNLQGYIEKLENIAKAERIHNTLSVGITEIEKGAQIEEIVSQILSSTLNAMSNEKRNFNHTMKQTLSSFIDNLDLVYNNRENGEHGIKLGINGLDKPLGGIHPSDLCVVGARPGQGKTAAAITFMLNIAKTGKRVGIISTEMAAMQLELRITSAESHIPAYKLRDANLDDTDWPRLTAATQRVIDLPIRICDKPNVSITDVTMQCKAWMIDGGIDFIIVDYLTRVKPSKNTGNFVQDIGEVVTGLKNIARTLNIPVMVLAQLNREAANKRPVMANLRDSGIIEQEADQVILLYRDEDNEYAPAEMIIEKNRHGQSSIIVLCHFDKETMRWMDYDGDYQQNTATRTERSYSERAKARKAKN